MDFSYSARRLTLSFATAVAVPVGIAAAVLLALAPAEWLESLVVDSGVAAVLPAAEPPLGWTARSALVLIGAGGLAAVTWAGLYLLFGNRPLRFARRGVEAVAPLAIRRADAHPDANPRRPLSASRDLPPPANPRPTEEALPQPALLAPGERIEIYDLTPVVQDAEIVAVPVERGPERRQGWRLPAPEALPTDHRALTAASQNEPDATRPIVAPAQSEALPEWLQPADLRLVVPAPADESPVDAAPSPARASLDQLIARLEQGVDRLAEAPAPAAIAPPPAPTIEQDVDNLERTLATLRRLGSGVG